jgi:hypothetical protein
VVGPGARIARGGSRRVPKCSKGRWLSSAGAQQGAVPSSAARCSGVERDKVQRLGRDLAEAHEAQSSNSVGQISCISREPGSGGTLRG